MASGDLKVPEGTDILGDASGGANIVEGHVSRGARAGEVEIPRAGSIVSRALAVLVIAALGACTEVSVIDDDFGQGGTGGEPPSFDLRIEGMEGAAEVSFDEAGMLHASCETDGDCMRILGYFHASHRFWQMDLQRRAARGRLATLIPLQLETDIRNRAMFCTSDGKPLEAEIWRLLSAEERALVESYSQGVNGWLSDLREGKNGARLSEEYGVFLVVGASPETIPDWEPLDTIAFVRLMTFALSDVSDTELEYAQAFAKLAAISPETAVDFLTLRPAVKAYTVPSAGAQALTMPPDREMLAALGERLLEAQDLFEEARKNLASLSFFRGDGGFGSNNWVLAPSRTEAGKAILANDPHLSLGNPSMFYLAHLDSKSRGGGTLNVAGATFPGIPAVAIGRNETLAWGATVAFFDAMDLYVEELNAAKDAVILHDAEVPILRRQFEFQVAGKEEPHRETLEWVPHHGPILSRDDAKGRATSLRWTGHEPSNELRAFLGLNRARTVEEAKEALRSFEVGAQNFVLADVEGSIGWFPHARVPKRPWARFSRTSPLKPSVSLPPWMPLPGDGSAEWDGYLTEEELPKLFDPPAGFIATANQDLTGATETGDPTSSGRPMLQNLADPGVRMGRIVQQIEAAGKAHTPTTSMDLQMDDFSLLGSLIVPSLAAAAEAAEAEGGEGLSDDAKALMAVLEAWQYTCPTGLKGNRPDAAPHPDEEAQAEAAGCAAFHFTLPRILSVAFGERIKAAGMGWSANLLVRPLIVGLHRPQELMNAGIFWNDLGAERTKEEVLVAALEKAAKEIRNRFGEEPQKWLWGRHHTVTFKTELSIVDPRLDIGPFAAPGGLFTVNVANPPLTGSAFEFNAGAALRIVNELGEDGIATWLQLPGGRDLHRDGAHYGDRIEAWLEGKPFQLAFTQDEVEAAAASTILVGP